MIINHVMYDAQFSFVNIYKVSKCMMPNVLKICSDLKSRVVYSSLNSAFMLYIFYSLGLEPTTICTSNAMLYHWATVSVRHLLFILLH